VTERVEAAEVVLVGVMEAVRVLLPVLETVRVVEPEGVPELEGGAPAGVLDLVGVTVLEGDLVLL
jgi:hypothetical protein